MNFSTISARHIVPLLARAVLCLVFIPAGWGKVMVEEDFTGSDLTSLRELGVVETPKDDAKDNQDTVKARKVNSLAIYLKAHDAPQPVIAAWMVALIEVIGGGLILIGLFTRLWAFGLAGIMGTAFALESIPAICGAGSVFSLSSGIFNTAAAHLSLAVLAFGLLLTGAGFLSLDSAIFAHRRHARHKLDEEELDEE